MEKRILDEETKKALLGMMPFNLDVNHRFTPARFAGVKEEFRPVFLMRALTRKEANEAKMILVTSWREKDEAKIDTDKIISVVENFLEGWENMFDVGTGEELPYTEENIARLPDVVLADILYEGTKISGLLNLERLSLVS